MLNCMVWSRELCSQLGVKKACHTAVQTRHHQNKNSLTCSCLSSFQRQSRVSPCGGGLLSLHWKRRNKWTQIKTYTTPAVHKDDLSGDVWLHDVMEALHKNDTKVCHPSYLHPIIVIKVKHHHCCMSLRRKSQHSGSDHILITQETVCSEHMLTEVQIIHFQCKKKKKIWFIAWDFTPHVP